MRTPTPIRRQPRRWVAATLAAAFLTAAPAVDARLDPTTGAYVPEEPAVVVVESGGFDWADAAIGAGAAAGMCCSRVARPPV
jgi:hypothetical protein